jgi:methyl-accepting chemotaxis protein
VTAHDALVIKTNAILEEVERMRKQWERSNPSIESVNQMRIAAKGYISSLEEANKALFECVDGMLEQMDDMTKINEEIARTAEAMAKMANELELRGKQ